MAKRRKSSSYFPTKIPINSLSGGVGRQAPTKRMPNEAEDMVNMIATTERSIDKRNGFEVLPNGGNLNVGEVNDKDMWWYWYVAGNKQTFLIGLDYQASSVSSQLLFVYKINEDGTLVEQVVDSKFTGNSNQEITGIREYLTHNTSGASSKDSLRACSVGSSILVLNTEVKAGFTNDETGDTVGFNLNGLKDSNIESIKGAKIKYLTTLAVDPKGEAEVWTSVQDFVWGQSAINTNETDNDNRYDYLEDEDPQSEEPTELDRLRFGIYKVKDSVEDTALPGPTLNDSGTPPSPKNNAKWERVTDADDPTGYLWSNFIPVEDYVYPNGNKLHLGQAVSKLSDLKFPPDGSDLVAYNGDVLVTSSIKELYPDSGDATGKGKIIYLSQAYLSATPGWYRVINRTETPYLEKIRTPDAMSVLDEKRLPMQIFLDSELNAWSIRFVSWDPRTSGTASNNPGPSFFTTTDKKAKQIEIKAMSYYRDRLFFATEDTLTSSKLGDFSNFFLDNPANITFTDPIDLKVSSNVYTPITFLKPFKDFLFMGTAGDTQYELVGSENQISPLTAEIAPTSFFPMTEDVEPMVMNNNLFFFSKKRLFIYFQRFEAAGQQAFELSRHVPDYIAESFWDTAVSTAHNMIFAIEGDEPSNTILCYRNQVQGDQVVQNAFFKFIVEGDQVIESLNAIGDYLYAVVKEGGGTSIPKYKVCRLYLIPENEDLPRIDNRQFISFVSVSYNPTLDETTFVANSQTTTINTMVFSGENYVGSMVDAESNVLSESQIEIKVNGNYSDASSAYIGTKFTSSVTLSDIFVRDEKNNVIPGTLNLRYGIIRHRKTGNYNVLVTRKNRTEKSYLFEHRTVDGVETQISGELFEKDGVFKFPILGFTDDIGIKISSDYPYPINLTNIEITGKFKRVPHFLTT